MAGPKIKDKRGDNDEDPLDFKVSNYESGKNRAYAGYKLLNAIMRSPGQKDDGTIDTGSLVKWIEQVCAGAAAIGRTDIADQMIGKLVSPASADADGVWPCIAVRDALELVMVERIERGICVALFN